MESLAGRTSFLRVWNFMQNLHLLGVLSLSELCCLECLVSFSCLYVGAAALFTRAENWVSWIEVASSTWTCCAAFSRVKYFINNKLLQSSLDFMAATNRTRTHCLRDILVSILQQFTFWHLFKRGCKSVQNSWKESFDPWIALWNWRPWIKTHMVLEASMIALILKSPRRFICFKESSLSTLVKRVSWVSCGSSEKQVMVSAEVCRSASKSEIRLE